MTTPHPAVLEAKDLRVDAEGLAAVEALSLRTEGDHVLVLGAARAFFEAASGMRDVARGTLTVNGQAPREAVRVGALSGAPLDPPLPASWTLREYVVWSARLAGHAPKAAKALAHDAMAALHIDAHADAKLAKVPPHVRRAMVIAAAVATGAKTILFDDPLSGLPEDVARQLAKVLTIALEDRAWVAFAPRVPLTSPLALYADEALLISGSDIVAQGAPAEIAAEERVFAVRVGGEARAFADRVAARGGRISGMPPLFTVQLGELTTHQLFILAEESRAIILELFPAARAFG